MNMKKRLLLYNKDNIDFYLIMSRKLGVIKKEELIELDRNLTIETLDGKTKIEIKDEDVDDIFEFLKVYKIK